MGDTISTHFNLSIFILKRLCMFVSKQTKSTLVLFSPQIFIVLISKMSQSKNDDDKSESDASVSFTEASQIIRETLAKTHQTNTDCMNHTISNIVSKGGVNGVESYDYVHNPIPSAVYISPVAKGSSSNKRNHHKTDDDDGDLERSAYEVRRKRQRRKKWLSKEVPVPSFSQNVKKPCSSYNCNKILNQKEKMERKRISVATDRMKEMPQVSSIMVERKPQQAKLSILHILRIRSNTEAKRFVYIVKTRKSSATKRNTVSTACKQHIATYTGTMMIGWQDLVQQ